MKIAITGSGGMLGGCISRVAKRHGHQVVPIHFASANTEAEEYLDAVINCLKDIRDCDFIIHCASSKSPRQSFDFYLNAKVPKVIEDYIYDQNLNCKLIHVSSINVIIGSLEDKYTESKRQGEKSLNKAHTTIIRPGLLWSPNEDPILTKLCAYFSRPLIPKIMFKPGNIYSPVDPDALASFIVSELVELDAAPKVINILGDRKYSLWELMKELANRSHSRLIPVPTIWFRFVPWRWGIKRLNMPEIFNQMLTIDRTSIPIARGETLVTLPFSRQET
jgi:nucleoside-diphosphate-sugar epimerase